MAHLANSYTSYAAFLEGADAFWKVDFDALNSSGVSGTAILATATEEDGTQYLNVAITAEGLTPGIGHIQHIHGRFDEAGNPINSVSPTLANDTDRDGMVEVLEGVGQYGDVLLTLQDADGEFTPSDAMGQLSFFQSYDLGDDSQFMSPVTGTQYEASDIMPLALREIVLHGVTVPDGIGEGTMGEVNGGENGFIPILPAAAGEIEAIDMAEAMRLLGVQRDIASDMFNLGNGNDTFGAGPGDDTVFGNGGDDFLNGGADDDVISGGAGNDRLIAGSGRDAVDGGDGNDRIDAGVADDNQMDAASTAAAGNLPLSEYDNGLTGGAGNDLIRGRDGDDIITGDDDSRVQAVTGRAFDAMADGADTIFGGAGNDEIHTGSWADGDQGLANVSTGMMGDIAYGEAGNDILRGANGDDYLHGGTGNDNIGGGMGADTLIGGEGSDTYLVDDAAAMVMESRKWEGTDTVISTVDFAMGRQHIENLTLSGTADLTGVGNGLANVITGNAGSNTLDGMGNLDTLVGGMGDDIYRVRNGAETIVEMDGEGTDSVFAFNSYLLADNVENLALQTTADLNGIGNAMDNMITGNSGDNVLAGRGGNDWLRGGAGADSFVFDMTPNAESNVDIVADFGVGDDMIVLRSKVFSGLDAEMDGTLMADQFAMGSMAMDADDRIIYDAELGNVYYDADGAGGMDQMLFARISNGAMLEADDFMIV